MATKKKPNINLTPQELAHQIMEEKRQRAIKHIIDPRMRKYMYKTKGKAM